MLTVNVSMQTLGGPICEVIGALDRLLRKSAERANSMRDITALYCKLSFFQHKYYVRQVAVGDLHYK